MILSRRRTFHGRGLRLLQDGVPLNLADGSFDFQALEPLSTRYINIWRGGNALAFGGSTLGGAIDYLSRTGRDAPRAFARVELGSFGYRRATFASGSTHGRAQVFVEIDLLGTAWTEAAPHRLALRCAWTYGRFRFADDPHYGRNVLAGLPPHLVRGALMWESDTGWYAGPTFEWVPQKSFIDHRNTLAAAP